MREIYNFSDDALHISRKDEFVELDKSSNIRSISEYFYETFVVLKGMLYPLGNSEFMCPVSYTHLTLPTIYSV